MVDLRTLVSGLSILCTGSRDDKVNSVFLLYDLNDDGLVNVIFSGNTRYIVVVYYTIIACIAYGIVHFRWAKDSIYFSWVIMFTLILLFNKNTMIFLPMVLTLSTCIVFQLITWLYRKDKLFFS